MKKKKIGLALGAGSARGFAHIGVLSALERAGIRPDFVAGTSIGAAIGSLYCSGISPEYMKRIAVSTEWQELLDFTVPKTGLIAGNTVEQYMQELTNNCRFSDLIIPLKIIATDLKNSEKVVFFQGNVAKAVRASISIPGVFSPVKIDSRELVDGALVDPIPISIVQSMGADIIIAVDLSLDFNEVHIHGSRVKERATFSSYMRDRFLKSQIDFFKEFVMETKRFRLPHFVKKYLVRIIDRYFNPKRLYDFMMKRRMPHILSVTLESLNIISNQLYKEQLKNSDADIIIRPKLRPFMISGFDKVPQIIKSGEQAAQDSIKQIEKLIR